MAKLSANYEVLYIIDPTLGEEETAALVARFKELAEGHGLSLIHILTALANIFGVVLEELYNKT